MSYFYVNQRCTRYGTNSAAQQMTHVKKLQFFFQEINTFKPQAGRFDTYKKSVKELLFFASELSEGQKAISEFFDDKIKSVFASTLHMGLRKNLSPDEYSQLDLTTKLAVFDALIGKWERFPNHNYKSINSFFQTQLCGSLKRGGMP